MLKTNKKMKSSSLYSEDLAPIPLNKRSWNTWNYAWFAGFLISGMVYYILMKSSEVQSNSINLKEEIKCQSL